MVYLIHINITLPCHAGSSRLALMGWSRERCPLKRTQFTNTYTVFTISCEGHDQSELSYSTSSSSTTSRLIKTCSDAMAWPVLPVVLESGITYALSRNLLERSVYLAYLKLSRELYPLTLFLLGKRTLSED